MADKQPVPVVETIVINNFGGRLTRIVNGAMNSGFAKFDSSFGYDPFTKPMNLTWLEQPTSIVSGISDLPLAAMTNNENGAQFVYMVGSLGKLYKMQPYTSAPPNPNVDSVVGIASVSGSFNYGASIEQYGNDQTTAYVAADEQIRKVGIAASFGANAPVGNLSFMTNTGGHYLIPFNGTLVFGNGNTIGVISATGTVTSSVIGTGQGNLYSQLNPPLPVSNYVHDMDVTYDGTQAFITASEIQNEPIMVLGSEGISAAASSGYLYRWNGTDQTVTSFNQMPSYAVTALQTYLTNNYFFADDSFGASMSDSGQKKLTLTNNKAPLPNATLVNGNFISWWTVETTQNGTMRVGSLYYYGSLDEENPQGLYRVLRYLSPLANGFVYQAPLNILTGNKFSTINNSSSSVLSMSLGKHYLSAFETSSGTSQQNRLLRFLITSTGTGIPQSGVYETQTQLFSKRIDIKQIRIYTEPTATGNGFQLDIIGSDGNVYTNGTFNYTYGSLVDPSNNSPIMERINYNPIPSGLYAVGIRLTNTGTTNMTIKKVEVDWSESGK